MTQEFVDGQGAEETFETVTVNTAGEIVQRHQGRGRYFVERLDRDVGLVLMAIPGGTFQMGARAGEGYDDERPLHAVTVSSFYLGRYPVTQAQWEAVMESNRSRFRGAALPVENVSWEEAVRFCARLAIKSGRAYGLPSEAQWEYACRAGTNTAFCYGPALTTDLANYNGEFSIARAPRGVYRHTTTPVGSFPPNAFGLHDLHGNVWEWCADTWHESYDGAPPDERPWRRGGDESRRVARGGSWHDTPEVCRSAVRLAADAAGDDFIGLRVALTGPL